MRGWVNRFVVLGFLILFSASVHADSRERIIARHAIASAIRGGSFGEAANLVLRGLTYIGKQSGYINSSTVTLYCATIAASSYAGGRATYCMDVETDRMIALAGVSAGAGVIFEVGTFVGVATDRWFANTIGSTSPLMCETMSGGYIIGGGVMVCPSGVDPLIIGGVTVGRGVEMGTVVGVLVRSL